ncbi:hypothetical protein AB0F81_04180 [Actinoplanes sp. NPDC024001]|uniref:hypothetical protein n=1 Tax=Actinoplanes sp. NPDC024001 TaxID=3154598 RepID=UPI0033C25370
MLISKNRRRAVAALASAAFGLALLTGCGDDVSCGLDQCTVSIARENNASVSVLGVEAKFVSADENTVTLDVGGEQIQLTKGQQAVDVAGLQVQLESVTADQIQIEVSKP